MEDGTHPGGVDEELLEVSDGLREDDPLHAPLRLAVGGVLESRVRAAGGEPCESSDDDEQDNEEGAGSNTESREGHPAAITHSHPP